MRIAYISTYPPRECGIATFNQNLVKAVTANLPEADLAAKSGFIVALNDSPDLKAYHYPDEVKYVIRQNHQNDYMDAAKYLNESAAEVCLLEHEFGIYGGESGIYVLSLINRLEKPLITIMHTVLKEPSFIQKIIVGGIANQSAKLVVMSKRAVEFLMAIYDIPASKIMLIEHGVPNLEKLVNNPVKNTVPFKNRRVLFTFGLISRNKGLETVIKALPKIVEKHPDVMYVILGNTHPGVIKNNGEEYRVYLKNLAEKLNVSKHLTFINKFVSEEELFNYLTAANIYITPYLNEAQITSGTLSYAIGAGAAVVSTPYWHATELLADNRGKIFDFKDAITLSAIVNDLLTNTDKLHELKNNAFQYGLKLRWPAIGAEYIKLARQVSAKFDYRDKLLQSSIIDTGMMPHFSLDHVIRLTDDTGIVQHAKYGIPNLKEGYCLDDNARALILALMAYQHDNSNEAQLLLPVYLSYIHYMQTDDGNFRNFLSFNRQYLDEVGTDDSFGRTIWALGYHISNTANTSYREFALEMFHKAIPHCQNLHHLRGLGNAIIGISLYLKVFPSDETMLELLVELTEKLTLAYEKNHADEWHWFEEKMTYDNAILPLALIHSFKVTGNERVKQIAINSMEFLDNITLANGYLCPVGNDGWYHRGSVVPLYDQQAIETMAMVLMNYQAYQVWKKPKYLEKMFLSYMWFMGENTLHAPLYDYETKGCCDGLLSTGINRNQGAESTLAYLISHLTVLGAFEQEYEGKNATHSFAAFAK